MAFCFTTVGAPCNFFETVVRNLQVYLEFLQFLLWGVAVSKKRCFYLCSSTFVKNSCTPFDPMKI